MTAPNGFTLASALPGEAGQIAALHRNIMGENDGWSDSGLRRVLSASAARGWIALADQSDAKPAGFVVAFAAAGEAEILAIGVAEEYRRLGIARSLLRQLAAQLAAEGVACLHLEVRASNFTARQLYTRNGFNETGLRKHYYQGIEDAVTMTCALAALC